MTWASFCPKEGLKYQLSLINITHLRPGSSKILINCGGDQGCRQKMKKCDNCGYDFAKQNNQRKFWRWKRKFIHPLATSMDEMHFEWTRFSINMLDDRTPPGPSPAWMNEGDKQNQGGGSGKFTFIVPSNRICTPSAERRVTLRTAHFRKFKPAVWKTLCSVITIRYILYEYIYPRLIFTNQNEPYG